MGRKIEPESPPHARKNNGSGANKDGGAPNARDDPAVDELRDALKGTTAGALRAFLDAAGSIFNAHVSGLTDEPESVNSARGRVQKLVKADLGTLRTEVEDLAPLRALPRLSAALDRVQQAALELMESLDGRNRSELISGRRLRMGPWAEPLNRLHREIENANWLMYHVPRLLQATATTETSGDDPPVPVRNEKQGEESQEPLLTEDHYEILDLLKKRGGINKGVVVFEFRRSMGEHKVLSAIKDLHEWGLVKAAPRKHKAVIRQSGIDRLDERRMANFKQARPLPHGS